MSQTFAYIAAAIVAAILFAVLSATRPGPLEPDRRAGTVSYVIDGDTIILEGVETRLRLWGIDAPERGEDGYEEARNALYRMVQGKRITFIELDRDRYGRIVARVFLKDGREANRLMIESGAAQEFCRYSKGFYGRC